MWGTRAFLAAVVALAVLPATAAAEPRWFAPQPISPFGWTIAGAEIDAAGKSVALLNSTAGLATTTRLPGGAFGAPQGLPYVTGDEPQLGMDGSGGAVVAWRAQPSGIRQATVRSPSGGWQPPVNITTAGDFNSNLWTLDVGVDGTAAISWLGGLGMRVRVRPPGGAFGPAEDIAVNNLQIDKPLVHVDPTGGVHIFMGTTGGDLLYAERDPGGEFGDPDVLASDVTPAPGEIASSPNGALAVTWNRFTPDPDDEYSAQERLLLVRDSDDTELGPVEVVPGHAFESALGVGDDGEVLTVWRGWSSDGRRAWLESAVRAPDGQTGPVQTISSTTGMATNPAIGLDDDGEAVVIWHQAGPSSGFWAFFDPKHVESAIRAPGEDFGPPAVLTPDAVDSSSALAVSRARTAVAIWTESVVGRSCVKAVVRAETSQPGDARTCAQVRAPIVPGGSPDVTPPGLRFGGPRTLKLAGPVVTLTATCTEACALSTFGSVTTSGAARTFKLKGSKTKLLPAGKRAKLRLKLSKRSYKAIRKALKRKRKVKAVIRVTARDKGGAKRTFKRTLKLKRSR